jgi:hypothetical protein
LLQLCFKRFWQPTKWNRSPLCSSRRTSGFLCSTSCQSLHTTATSAELSPCLTG